MVVFVCWADHFDHWSIWDSFLFVFLISSFHRCITQKFRFVVFFEKHFRLWFSLFKHTGNFHFFSSRVEFKCCRFSSFPNFLVRITDFLLVSSKYTKHYIFKQETEREQTKIFQQSMLQIIYKDKHAFSFFSRKKKQEKKKKRK